MFMCTHKRLVEMLTKIKNIKQLGAMVKYVRQSQSVDQETAGLLDQSGIEVVVDLPPGLSQKAIKRIENVFSDQ